MSTRLSVYNGVCLLGEIEDHAREGVRAFLGTGKKRKQLGVFPDRRSAMRAVYEAVKAAPTSQAQEAN